MLRLKMSMTLALTTVLIKFPTQATVTHHRLRILPKAFLTPPPSVGGIGSRQQKQRLRFSDQPNDFITSLGLTMRPGLEALAAKVNASKPAPFHDAVLVARQVLDSGRDLAIVPPGTFEQFCQSEVRSQLCQLLVHDRLTSYSLTDLLKAVSLVAGWRFGVGARGHCGRSKSACGTRPLGARSAAVSPPET